MTPRIEQEKLLTMVRSGTGRHAKSGPSHPIRRRPPQGSPPLAEGPLDTAAEQNIPFRDRQHIRRYGQR